MVMRLWRAARGRLGRWLCARRHAPSLRDHLDPAPHPVTGRRRVRYSTCGVCGRPLTPAEAGARRATLWRA
jgi:hypothetical protein